jgi:peptidyl-prolyl cis-trans isomerase B (cyclophilin B)
MKEPDMKALMKTSSGMINLTLFSEKTPTTVASFVNLAKRGYYDGLTFHRVIENFMIQGGCPLGTGPGGPGYSFKDECRADLKHSGPGILSMANSGPNTNGSQFFITHLATPWLDGKHTVFGKVEGEEDMKTVNAIRKGDTIVGITIEGEVDELLESVSPQVKSWNAVLDR